MKLDKSEGSDQSRLLRVLSWTKMAIVSSRCAVRSAGGLVSVHPAMISRPRFASHHKQPVDRPRFVSHPYPTTSASIPQSTSQLIEHSAALLTIDLLSGPIAHPPSQGTLSNRPISGNRTFWDRVRLRRCKSTMGE